MGGTIGSSEFAAVPGCGPTSAIDDGGLRAFAPLSDDFIMAPDGSFVGEDAV